MSGGRTVSTARIYTHNLRTTLRGLVLPCAGALGLCFVCLHSLPPQEGTGADRGAGYWLHLPGLLLVATCLGALLEGWPLLSRARPGFGWILRVESRPLHGCGVAALGGLTALASKLEMVVSGVSATYQTSEK